jgi:hypothetical protein
MESPGLASRMSEKKVSYSNRRLCPHLLLRPTATKAVDRATCKARPIWATEQSVGLDGSGPLTSQDHNLLPRVLTQEGLDEVIGHRKQLGGWNRDPAM